jgi:hypothetical protein
MEKLLVVVADYANITGNGKLNIMGIFNEINAISYPYVHPSMFLIFKFRSELGEFNTTKQVIIKLVDGDGKTLLEIPQDIKIPEIKEGKRPEINGVLSLNNLVFPKEGSYVFVVVVNGDPKGNVSIVANPPHKQG